MAKNKIKFKIGDKILINKGSKEVVGVFKNLCGDIFYEIENEYYFPFSGLVKIKEKISESDIYEKIA